MGVYENLANVQKALKAPKNQVNKFGGYNYRSCEDILEAAKPLCVENGLVLTLSDSIKLISDRVYVSAIATVTDIKGNGSVSTEAYAREPLEKKGSDVSQITGAASSYARKYALNGLFCIDDTKDADATNDHGKGKTAKDNKSDEQKNREMVASVDPVYLVEADGKVTIAQRKKFDEELIRTGVKKDVVLGAVNAKSIDDLSGAQMVTLLNRLAKTKDKA